MLFRSEDKSGIPPEVIYPESIPDSSDSRADSSRPVPQDSGDDRHTEEIELQDPKLEPSHTETGLHGVEEISRDPDELNDHSHPEVDCSLVVWTDRSTILNRRDSTSGRQ